MVAACSPVRSLTSAFALLFLAVRLTRFCLRIYAFNVRTTFYLIIVIYFVCPIFIYRGFGLSPMVAELDGVLGTPEPVIVKMEPLIFLTLKTSGEGLHKEC